MKIRQGFVSNSSSSSFLIRTDGEYKTVYDVAKQMMLDMQSDVLNYNKELKQLENVKDKDVPVYFDSSDGGYIRKFKDYIIVSTTMHYSPDFSLKREMINFDEVGSEYFKELEYKSENDITMMIESCEDFDYYWEQFNDFLLLKSGIYGVWDYDFFDICPDCERIGRRIVKLKNGETICGCKATKKYNRKLKLDKLKNNEN